VTKLGDGLLISSPNERTKFRGSDPSAKLAANTCGLSGNLPVFVQFFLLNKANIEMIRERAISSKGLLASTMLMVSSQEPARKFTDFLAKSSGTRTRNH
jgi:hypothetical protein